MRKLLVLGLGLAIALMPAIGSAGPKPKAAKTQLTEQDIRSCMGVNGAKAGDQIKACTKIINSGNVKPEYLGDYYATRGAAYLASKQPDKALADLDKALSFRKAPEFYIQRGLIQLTRRKFDLAKADLAEAIKLKPQFAPAYLMRGLASYQAGEYKEALGFFDEALKRVPTYYQALYARGVAKKRTGDESGGDKDMKDARDMRPTIDEEMKKLGVAPT